ncbi:photosynthetic NDH subunit of subcomplex B 2, chloroplastic [Mercurialis annua]|uniref:photosynthetic NDH subunit of subcomplex B 2, chloroplastic n=1 Tax=Mercurialis annua TaxID=3986 RepID=UPI00215DD6B4|nr:photosynthetic NDH subunit of subcomplex B 2, chloroplastic [Mercurialis annua]
MASLLSLSIPKPNIIKATSSSTDTILSTPEILEEKFGRKGIKFLESNNKIPTVELTVRNGSSLKLQIPDAHVTSYKPKVYWKDDGFHELLHTIPAKDSASKDKGGIGLVINDGSDSGSKGSLISSEWTVKYVDSDAIDALQVELECTSGTLELSYIVSLYPESIATAVIVKNNGRKDVTLRSAILSHIKFKRREQAAIQGFKGCSYLPQPPLSSPFEILSPAEAMKSESPSGFLDFTPEIEDKLGVWGVQDVPFTMLKYRFSRVYAAPPQERSKGFYNTPPSKYEALDQGNELFFRVVRMGFEDTYVGSPGSLSDKYGGKEYFICTGPAAMLVPVVVKPGQSWKGAQVIEHDNL